MARPGEEGETLGKMACLPPPPDRTPLSLVHPTLSTLSALPPWASLRQKAHHSRFQIPPPDGQPFDLDNSDNLCTFGVLVPTGKKKRGGELVDPTLFP